MSIYLHELLFIETSGVCACVCVCLNFIDCFVSFLILAALDLYCDTRAQ